MHTFQNQIRKDRYIYLFLFVNILMVTNKAFSQNKLEKEYRLPDNEIPTKAIAFVDSLVFQDKIKWYKEIGEQEESIEAKTCKDHQKYSIEFDTKGRLQDIEIEKDWKKITDSVREKIASYLHTVFEKHKIRKIQIQYSGTNKNLWLLLTKQIKSAPHQIKYEMIVKGSSAKEKELYEMLFSENGLESITLIV